MAKANKLIPVVDGTAGTPIELIDSRININNPTNEDVLMYNSLSGKFEANSIGAVVTEVALTGDYDDLTNKPTIPDSTSDLTNDSGFITANDVPQEVFVCTYTETDSTNHTGTMNKTSAEIAAAKAAGKVVLCIQGGTIYYCVTALVSSSNVSIVQFARSNPLDNGGDYVRYIYNHNGGTTWYKHDIIIQEKLVSGTNIKTINGDSILGSGDLTIDVGDVNVQSDWGQTDSTADDYIKRKPTIPASTSDLTNDSGFITLNDVPSELPSISGNASKVLAVNSGATGVEWVNQSGGGSVTVDTEISETSTNPVQNKAIGVELRKLWDKKDIVSRLDNEYESHNNYIATASGKWVSSSTYKHWIVPVDGIREVTIVANSSTAEYVAFFDTYTSTTSGTTPDYSQGWSSIIGVTAGTSSTFQVPAGAAYMYLNTGNNNAAKASHVYLTGIGITDEFELPSLDNNAGKVLAVNSTETDVEWVTQSSGGTAHKETVYAVCSTAAATPTKEITVSEMPQHGDLIVVNFTAGVSVDNSILRLSDGTNQVDLAIVFCGFGLLSGLIHAGEVALFSVDFNNRRAMMISTDFAAATALTAVKIYNGTTTPASSLGSDGDIYIQTA